MLILQLTILSGLGMVWYQDMKYRAIHRRFFPMLATLLFMLKYHFIGLQAAAIGTLYALLFVVLNISILWLYLCIRTKKLLNLTNNYLCIGDILFLIVIAFYLSPVNYVLFYIGSVALIMIYVLVYKHFKRDMNIHIPLAGYQAFLLSIVFIYSLFNPNFTLFTDSWIYGLY